MGEIHCNVPLPPESPNAPVPTTHIRRIIIVDVPPQTPKLVLPRRHQYIHFPADLLLHPIEIALHIRFGISGADDWALRLQQLRQSLGPFVRARWMAQARVEENETVEVRIEGLEMAGFVQRVVVFDVGADFQLVADAGFDDGSEGVYGCPLWQGELGIPVRHAFGTDEDEVELYAREDVSQLHPYFPREGGLGTGSEDEEADWG